MSGRESTLAWESCSRRGGGVEFDDWQLHQVSQRDWDRDSGGFAWSTRSPSALQSSPDPNLSPFPLSLSLMCLARARRRETPNVRGRCALSAGMRGAMGCDGIAPLSRHLSASHTRALARVQALAHWLSWRCLVFPMTKVTRHGFALISSSATTAGGLCWCWVFLFPDESG